MRYFFGFMCVCALGLVPLVGCTDDGGTGGSGGFAGTGGTDGGTGGSMGDVFPCTEQGINDAIAEGGGPHTFDCNGPQTVVTQAEIVIDNDVALDGEGKLTVDGNETHRVFSVPEGATAELRGFTITRGAALPNPEANVGGIDNLGTLTMVNSTVSENVGAGISSGGTLVIVGSTVVDNGGGGIDTFGTLTLESSYVDVVAGTSGPITITNSTLGKVLAGEGQVLTLTSSTVVGEGVRLSAEAEAMLTSSIVDGDCGCGAFAPVDCGDIVTSNGYNIESPGDTCGFDQSTDLFNVSAMELNLGELADNGGPTMTHKPGAGGLGIGSHAIDRIPGNACDLTEDQRGQPRPETGGTMCDVGSVEVQP